MVRWVLSSVAILWAWSCVPSGVVRTIAAHNPGCVYEIPRRDKIVALTLDDGPDSAATPELLKILAANTARATFFLISSHLPGNDTLVTRMLREGHEIGNHFSRNEASIRLTHPEFVRSFLTADSALGSIYPFDPQIPVPAFSAWVIRRNVRPGAIIILHDSGYKGRNTIRTLRKLLPELTRQGYSIVTLSELAAPAQHADR